MDDATVTALTVQWLVRAVIGLNLCPFAKSVHVKGQIHYVVTQADSYADLIEIITAELYDLRARAPDVRETTLLIAPQAFPDFLDFNPFLPECDRLLRRLKLSGVFQIASFHPYFQFAGTDADDITNHTNRAPFPILHLLREASVDRAVEAYPQADSIFEKNKETLQKMGQEGWAALELYIPNKHLTISRDGDITL